MLALNSKGYYTSKGILAQKTCTECNTSFPLKTTNKQDTFLLRTCHDDVLNSSKISCNGTLYSKCPYCNTDRKGG